MLIFFAYSIKQSLLALYSVKGCMFGLYQYKVGSIPSFLSVSMQYTLQGAQHVCNNSFMLFLYRFYFISFSSLIPLYSLTKYKGLCLDSLNILPRYSPTIPNNKI